MLNHRLCFIMLLVLMASVTGCGTKAPSTLLQAKKSQETSSLPTEKKRSNSLPAAAFEEEEEGAAIPKPKPRTLTTKTHMEMVLERLDATEPSRLLKLQPLVDQMPVDQRFLITSVTKILKDKDWMRMGDDLQQVAYEYEKFFHFGHLIAVRVMIADFNEAARLVKAMKLVDPGPVLLFKVQFGRERSEIRGEINAAIHQAVQYGLTSLTNEQTKILLPYKEFFTNVPYNPPTSRQSK